MGREPTASDKARVRKGDGIGVLAPAAPIDDAAAQCLDLIAIAYAAIDAQELWNQLAAGLAHLLESEQATILLEDSQRPGVRLVGSTNAARVTEYLERFRAFDPFADDAVLAKMRGSRRCYLSHELIDDRSLRESVFYTDYWRRWGNLFWACGGHFELDDGVRASVAVLRDKAYGSFEESERALADRVVPHILRAGQLALRLTTLHTQLQRQAGALDELLDAVIVLAGNDRIAYANARARSLLGAHERTFHVRALKLATASEQQRLSEAIAQVRAGGGARDCSLRLQRAAPAAALHITLVPGPVAGSVQLYLRDPRWRLPLPHAMLLELFELTPAQAQICAHLLRDEAPEDIARELGVAVNTVRAQIKAALQKTGTHRVAQLVRLLTVAMPATRTGEPHAR